MRRYLRPAYVVPTLADTGIGGKRRIADRKKYKTGQLPASFPGHWTRADVRGLLHAMQGSVCAYCTRRTNGLDVEHFRPKGQIMEDAAHGGYWWLAYEASNYFLGCTVCNQKRKGTRFPLEDGAARVTYDQLAGLQAERRILIDPVWDPVENWLAIEWDDVTAELTPNGSLSSAEKARVQRVIDFFGLNLDPEVRSERSKAYEDAIRAANDQRWDDLVASAMRHRPHSFVARFVLLQINPALAPDEAAERRDRVVMLWRDLQSHVQQLRKLEERGGTPVEQDKRTLLTLAWALIVLRDDPVIGDAAVEAQLAALLAAVPDARDRDRIVATFADLSADLSGE